MRLAPLFRQASTAALVAGLITALSAIAAQPAAAAFPGPPGIRCTNANHGALETVINSAEVSPTLTHFISINITAGTTGERTETLSVMNTVTTSVGASASVTAEGSIGLAKVSATVGFTVQTTTSSTNTETTSMKWTFSQPGYYGLYKGTRAVSGTFQHWRCKAPAGSRGLWQKGFPTHPLDWENPPIPYTTYANFEAGTIACGDSVPPGSLREKARMQLGC